MAKEVTTITIIWPDGQTNETGKMMKPKIETREVKHIPDLREIKRGLDADFMLETIPYFTTYDGKECVAFCDEEGKLKGLRYNPYAQAMWEMCVGRMIDKDYLCGPIVIITGPSEMLAQL